MKKRLSLILLFLVSMLGVQAAVTEFNDALTQSVSKPALILVYAEWADNYQTSLSEFRNVQQTLGNGYNYVELDIAKPDAKFFNQRYTIMPNLPYVLMIRANGRITYFADKNCASSSACVISKAKDFVR